MGGCLVPVRFCGGLVLGVVILSMSVRLTGEGGE